MVDGRAQEDLQGKVLVGTDWIRMHAGEVKPQDYVAKHSDPVSGIHRNRAGFGKASG